MLDLILIFSSVFTEVWLILPRKPVYKLSFLPGWDYLYYSHIQQPVAITEKELVHNLICCAEISLCLSPSNETKPNQTFEPTELKKKKSSDKVL